MSRSVLHRWVAIQIDCFDLIKDTRFTNRGAKLSDQTISIRPAFFQIGCSLRSFVWISVYRSPFLWTPHDCLPGIVRPIYGQKYGWVNRLNRISVCLCNFMHCLCRTEAQCRCARCSLQPIKIALWCVSIRCRSINEHLRLSAADVLEIYGIIEVTKCHCARCRRNAHRNNQNLNEWAAIWTMNTNWIQPVIWRACAINNPK